MNKENMLQILAWITLDKFDVCIRVCLCVRESKTDEGIHKHRNKMKYVLAALS